MLVLYYWMQNIIQDLPGLITSAFNKLNVDATGPHFPAQSRPDQSRYGFRNPLCVITKLDAVAAVQQLPRPGLIWS